MRRREFLSGIGGAAVAWQIAARAQQSSGQMRRVGMLWAGQKQDPSLMKRQAAILDRLRELGYIDGKTIQIHARYAGGVLDRLPRLARELVALKVDVIVAVAVAASVAAREATAGIPIVMVNAGNPVGAGLIESLVRPGGNVTGTTNLLFGGKQVELIRELVPRVARLAILLNPTNAGAPGYIAEVRDAARRFNLSTVIVEVTRGEDFPNA